MINAELARKQTDDNVVLKPILKNIEDEIYKASLNGKYETRINMPIKKFKKICKILESFGYVCELQRFENYAGDSNKACVTVSWKGDNQDDGKSNICLEIIPYKNIKCILNKTEDNADDFMDRWREKHTQS